MNDLAQLLRKRPGSVKPPISSRDIKPSRDVAGRQAATSAELCNWWQDYQERRRNRANTIRLRQALVCDQRRIRRLEKLLCQ